MNKVLLTGRLTRDPEMRSLASGKNVTQFGIATNEYAANGKERAEYHNVVTWDRLGGSPDGVVHVTLALADKPGIVPQLAPS